MLTTLGMTFATTSANESGSPARAAVAVPSASARKIGGRRLRQDAMVFSGVGRRG
jgi:hypothetical protein